MCYELTPAGPRESPTWNCESPSTGEAQEDHYEMFTAFARRQCVCLVSAALVAVPGCSESTQLETAPVTGTVTLDGSPLSKGIVTFQPEYGRGATGHIQADGSYSLSTYRPSDGALVGKHKIGVISTESDPAKGPEGRSRSLVPARYATPGGSGLTADVRAGQVNAIDLKLTRK